MPTPRAKNLAKIMVEFETNDDPRLEALKLATKNLWKLPKFHLIEKQTALLRDGNIKIVSYRLFKIIPLFSHTYIKCIPTSGDDGARIKT